MRRKWRVRGAGPVKDLKHELAAKRSLIKNIVVCFLFLLLFYFPAQFLILAAVRLNQCLCFAGSNLGHDHTQT